MKHIYTILYAALIVFLCNCGDNKATTGDTTSENNASIEKEQAGDPSAQNADIIGEWELVGSIVDTNDNLQLDDDERKNLKTTMKDYMKLNGDGSGAFTIAKMEGRYEMTENNGKKVLTWYDEGNGRHRIGTIVKVTKDELHIKEPGGHGLFIWKRI